MTNVAPGVKYPPKPPKPLGKKGTPVPKISKKGGPATSGGGTKRRKPDMWIA